MSAGPTDVTKVMVGVVIELAILVAVLIVAVVIIMIIYRLHCIQHTGMHTVRTSNTLYVPLTSAGYLDPKSLKM